MIRSEHAWQLPDDAGLLARAKLALRAFFAVAAEPGHELAGPALNLSMDREVYARRAAELASTRRGRTVLAEREPVLRGACDLPALQASPIGSLGWELARYYERNGISPFESRASVRNDVEYLARRYRELHDAAHVLTGYGTDPVGEMELQAFVLGNAGLRNSLLVLTLVALLRPFGIGPVWSYARKLHAAHARGRRSADVVIAPAIELCWQLPLAQAREQIGLAPAP